MATTEKKSYEIELPEGCSMNEYRAFYATIDEYGGDKNGNTTVKLRNICSYRKDGNHIMIGDHIWIDNHDAIKITQLKSSAMVNNRPKRGTKLFMRAKCIIYRSAGRYKAKLAHFDKVECTKTVYWVQGGKKTKNTVMWHGKWKKRNKKLKTATMENNRKRTLKDGDMPSSKKRRLI